MEVVDGAVTFAYLIGGSRCYGGVKIVLGGTDSSIERSAFCKVCGYCG